MKKVLWFSLSVLLAFSAFGIGDSNKWSIDKWQQKPSILGTQPRAVKWSHDSEYCAFLWDSDGYDIYDIFAYSVRKNSFKRLTDVSELKAGSSPRQEKKQSEIKERMRVHGGGISSYVWHPKKNDIYFPFMGDIFKVSVDKGNVERITRTAAEELDPKISPSGEWLSFVRSNDLWLLNLTKGGEIQLTDSGSETILNGVSDYISLEELGRYSAYEWGPIGNAIAYVTADVSPVRKLTIPDYRGKYVSVKEQRRPRAGGANPEYTVNVVFIRDGKKIKIDIGDEKDFYITGLLWDPVGRYLLVLKESRDLKTVYFYQADSLTGEAEIINIEKDIKWVNIHNQFFRFSSDGDRLYYTSEREGWNHLYELNLNNRTEKKLTKGNWEITDINYIDRSNNIYFTSTRISPHQRHLEKLIIKTSKIEQLTYVEGWHECMVSPDGESAVELYQNNDKPGDLYYFKMNSSYKRTRITYSQNEEFDEMMINEPAFLTMKSRADGKMIFARMWRPERPEPRYRYPAVITIHGGGYSQSVRRAWRYTDIFHSILTNRGFIVLDIDYRGSFGYGREWRTDVYKRVGDIDLEDIMTGVEYLKSLPYVNSDRIGVWGWSYGGFLTCMAMFKKGKHFKAGVAVAPVCRWENYDSHYTEERFGKPQENRVIYRRGSPISYAKNLNGNLLLIHGVIDDNVHFQDTVQLAEELINRNKKFDIIFYPGGLHGIRGPGYHKHLFRSILDYFTKHLK